MATWSPNWRRRSQSPRTQRARPSALDSTCRARAYMPQCAPLSPRTSTLRALLPVPAQRYHDRPRHVDGLGTWGVAVTRWQTCTVRMTVATGHTPHKHTRHRDSLRIPASCSRSSRSTRVARAGSSHPRAPSAHELVVREGSRKGNGRGSERGQRREVWPLFSSGLVSEPEERRGLQG